MSEIDKSLLSKPITFSPEERMALKILVDYAARCCGGGEDTMGAILYTGAFKHLADSDSSVVILSEKIDGF